MKCPSCGRHASPRAKFCEYCGGLLAPRHSATPGPVTRSTNWPLLIAVLLGGLLLGAGIMYATRDQSQPAPVATAGFDPTLRGAPLASAFPEVFQVAAEFICPCGTCTDGLEGCDCVMVKGASEVRRFIYENLQAGHRPPHVIEMVAAKYGYRKRGGPPISFENLPPASSEPTAKQ